VSEVRNQLKYTLLPDGTVPVFLNGGQDEYRIPEEELKGFINYYGNSKITAGTQWFVPQQDDMGNQTFDEYIIPATDTTMFRQQNPNAHEGFVYGDQSTIFSAIRNNVPYKLDSTQKTATALYLANHKETGEYPDEGKIINLAQDVDARYKEYMASIEASQEGTEGEQPVITEDLFDKFQFYHQNDPEAFDRAGFIGSVILSDQDLQLIADHISGKEVSEAEIERIQNKGKILDFKGIEEENKGKSYGSRFQYAYILTGKEYDQLTPDEKYQVDYLIAAERLDSEYTYLNDTEKFTYMFDWVYAKNQQRYNKDINPDAEPKTPYEPPYQYSNTDQIRLVMPAKPAVYYDWQEIADMTEKEVMDFAWRMGWDGAIDMSEKDYQDFFSDITVEGATGRLPFVGGLAVGYEAWQTIEAIEALKDHNEAVDKYNRYLSDLAEGKNPAKVPNPYNQIDGVDTSSKHIDADQIIMLNQLMMHAERGTSIGYDILDILAEIPGFAIEIGAAIGTAGTSLIGTAAEEGTKQTAKLALKTMIKNYFSKAATKLGLEKLIQTQFKGMIPTYVLKGGQWVVKTGKVSAKAPFSPYFWSRWMGMAFEDYEHKDILTLQMKTQDGTYFDPSVAESVVDSYISLTMEIFSEQTGEKIIGGLTGMGKYAKGYFSNASQKLMEQNITKSIMKSIAKLNPNISGARLKELTNRATDTINWFATKYNKIYGPDTKLRKFAKKGFFGNPIEEMSEEELIKVMNVTIDKPIEDVYAEWKKEKNESGEDSSVERFMSDIQSNWLPASLEGNNPGYLGGLIRDVDNYEYHFPTKRELVTQFAAFSIPGMVSEAISTQETTSELNALKVGFQDSKVKTEYIDKMKERANKGIASDAEIAFLITKGEWDIDIETMSEDDIGQTIRSIGYLTNEERMELGLDDIELNNRLVLQALNTTLSDLEIVKGRKIKEAPLTYSEDSGVLEDLQSGKINLRTSAGINVIPMEEPIVDMDGNMAAAHYDVDTNTIQVNTDVLRNLPQGKGTVDNPGTERIITHEEAHAMYESLNENEKEMVTEMYDALPQEERAMYEEKFPTIPSYRASEWFAEQWQQKKLDGKDTSQLDRFFQYGAQASSQRGIENLQTAFGPGMADVIDYFQKLDPNNTQVYNQIEEIRTVMDEVEQAKAQGNQRKAEQILQQLEAQGDKLLDTETGERLGPEEVAVRGRNEAISVGDVIKDVISLYTGSNPGTVIEERAETWYKRQEGKSNTFTNFIASERANYESKTGEKTGESDLEWFSTLAVDYAFSGKTDVPVGKKLLNILNSFKNYLKSLFKRGEEFAEKVDRGDVSPALQDALQRSVTEEFTEGPTPADQTYQLKGWASGVNTTAQKRTILRRLESMANEGVVGRFWYEDSAKKIMELVNNDVVEAEKIIGLIALYSPQNQVNPNFKMAINAYISYKNNNLEAIAEIGRFPKSQSKKALSILETGIVPQGQKVNSFYQNLMWAVNPALNKPVTIDLWIMRAFGYTKDVPTELQYKTAEQEITKISNKLGWEPWQTQAAIWTSMKARYESVRGPMVAEAKKKGIDTNTEKFRKKLLNKAFNTKDFTITKYDFADSVRENTGNIVMEAVPGLNSGNLPKMINAPYSVKQNYHYSMVKSLYNIDGVDAIADILGLGQIEMFNAVGSYKNQTNPLSAKPVINPYFLEKEFTIDGKKVKFKNVVPQSIQEPLDDYMSMVGLLFQQDAMANSTFMKASSIKASNSMNFIGTRHLSPEEMSQVTDALYKEFGVTDYVPIPLPNNTPGFAVVNWVDGRILTEDKKINENYRQPWGGIENKEFHKKVKKALAKIDIKDLNLRIGYSAQAGNLIEGGKNGKNYIRKINESRRSDALWEFYNNTYQKINQINEGFSEKGLGKTKKLKKHSGVTYQLDKLKKPNKPGPLTLQQKLFFQNTAVKNRKGGVRMIHHGTWLPMGYSPFEVFNKTSDIGFHFGTWGQAKSRLRQQRGNLPPGTAPHIYNVYLNIQNPLELPDLGDFGDPQTLHRQVKDVVSPEAYKSLERYLRAEDIQKYRMAWKEALKREGYDGVMYINQYEKPLPEESMDPERLKEYRGHQKLVEDVIFDVFDINIPYDEFNQQLGDSNQNTPFQSYTQTMARIEEKLGPEMVSRVRDSQARISELDKWSRKEGNVMSYIAFDANQIKDVNNNYPTDNTNITYQLEKINAAEYKKKKAMEEAKNKIRTQSAKDKKLDVKSFIRKRRAYLDTKKYELILWARELKELTTEKERELIPFLIEGTGVPKELNRPDLESMMADQEIIDRLKPIVKNVRAKYNEIWKLMEDINEDLTDKQVENYVTHVWDIPKNDAVSTAGQWFAIQNKFLQKRYIPTLAEGISELGLKPKMLDIADIVAVYGNIAYNTIANKKFVEDIRTIENQGYKLITSDEVPGWKTLQHPVLKKPMGGYYHVHPDIIQPLEVVLGSRFESPFISALEAINGTLKKLQLSLSLFHHLALSETGVAQIGIFKTLKIINPWAMAWRGFLKGDSLAWEKTDVVKDGLAHGLQLGASEDINVEKIQGALDNFVRRVEKIPGVGNVAANVPKLLASFNEKWDSALWSWLHDGFKILGYEQHVSNLDPNLSAEELTKQKNEIAAFINDSFGGQNWDILMTTPKTRQIMGWFLLSPDWLTSTMRQFGSLFGIGAAHKETRKKRIKTGAIFWFKAALYFGVGMNALNCLNRKSDYKKNPKLYPEGEPGWPDCTMYGNTIGNQTYLFSGRNEDGTEKYIRWGKQFREFPELLYDDTGFSPVTAAKKKLGSKLSPVVQEAAVLTTNKSASGYTMRDLEGLKGWDWTIAYIKRLPTVALPFSTQKKIKSALGIQDVDWSWTDLFMPSGKGMTNYKATELYKQAIAEAIETGDPQMIKEVYYACIKNQMDPLKPFKAATSALSAEKSRSVNELNDTIEDWTNTLKQAIKDGDKTGVDRAKKKIKDLVKEKVNIENYEVSWMLMQKEFIKFQKKYPEMYKDIKLLPLK